MTQLNVLLVTYSFPPIGGVGVLRAASLARYLPGYEIRLDVLTARNASAVGIDPGLLKEIPSEVTIHRTTTLDLPFGVKKWIKQRISRTAPSKEPNTTRADAGKPGLLKRFLQDLLLPDPQVTWLPILRLAARRIVKSRKIDLVLITVPPFSSVLLVKKLRDEFPHLAIVVDFRDEWLSTAIELFGFSGSDKARRTAREIERTAVQNATTIVAVSEAARREIRSRYPEEPDSKFQLVPNGFDSTRLTTMRPSFERQPGEPVVITHVGTVYRTTDPSRFIEALQSLPLDARSRFLFRFIGHIEEPRFREALLKLGEMVELRGFVPQREALAAMNDSDYVLLISHDPLNVGAKFYDYVGGRKPILAIVHAESDLRMLIEQLRVGWWTSNEDVNGICQLFLAAADRGSSLTVEFQPDVERIAQYERKALAKQYASLLHQISGRDQETGLQAPHLKPGE